jgi:hypothetical protein
MTTVCGVVEIFQQRGMDLFMFAESKIRIESQIYFGSMPDCVGGKARLTYQGGRDYGRKAGAGRWDAGKIARRKSEDEWHAGSGHHFGPLLVFLSYFCFALLGAGGAVIP